VCSSDLLREAARDWQVTFDATSDSICLLDTDQRILRCNRTMAEMFGMKQEELIGRRCWEIVHGTMEPIPECPVTRMKSSLVREKMDLQRENRWFSVTADPILDETRTIQGVVHIVRDITERKKAAEVLSESEYKYKSLINNVPDVIFTIDLEGKLTFVSQRTKEILGYENEETINKNIFDFIPEEDHQRALENLQKGMKGEKIKNFQIPMIAKSGDRLFFECSFSRIYKDGEVVGAQGTAVDITERKKFEEDLQLSEERFRLLSEATFEAIVIHEEGVIFYANDHFFKMFGYEPDEMFGKEMISATFAPESLEFIKKRVATNSLELCEAIGLRKDGTKFPMEIRTRSMEYKGRTVRCGALRDITARKQAEEELRNSEEKYRLIFEYSPLGLLSFDEKGVIVACNDNFVKIIGSSREKLIGLNMLNLPDKNIVSAIQKALNGGHGLCEGDYSSTTAKKITPVRCIFTPMDVEGGRVSGGVGIIEDITERRKKEEIHNQLAVIVESADDAIMSKDLEGIIISWNNGAEVEYAYNANEIIGKSISLLMPPNYPDDYKEILAKIAHDEKIKHYETKRRRKNGQIIDVSLTVSPIKNTSGKIIGASTITRNITERKQAEDVLRINEQRYRIAEAIGHVGNWEYNLQTTKFWGSDEAKRIYGFDPEALDFSTDEVENCIPERERVHQALVDLIEADKPYNLEFEIHPKNSLTPRIISSVAELKRDEHGNPLLVTGVIQDITKRKQDESARVASLKTLLESEERYKALFDRSLNLIYVMDFDGKFIDANNAVLNLFGYKKEDVSSVDIKSLLDEDQLQLVLETIREIKQTGIQKDLRKIKLRHKDGRTIYVEAQGSTIISKGKPIAIQVIAHDITERGTGAAARRDVERDSGARQPAAPFRADLEFSDLALPSRHRDARRQHPDLVRRVRGGARGHHLRDRRGRGVCLGGSAGRRPVALFLCFLPAHPPLPEV
jgi:PAS domain S-box-containing protein